MVKTMNNRHSTLKKLFTTAKTEVSPLDAMPDFQNMHYRFATGPSGSTIRAWSKLRECERRLEMYKWVASLNNPREAQHRILLNDTVSAFLLTFEATIQFLNEEFQQSLKAPHFSSWMAGRPQYDVTIRGLRTLRHFEAHVESKTPRSNIGLIIGGSRTDGTSDTEVTRAWRLPTLQQNELARLDHSPLAVVDLSDWNNLVSQTDVADIFADGIRRLSEILVSAESLI